MLLQHWGVTVLSSSRCTFQQCTRKAVRQQSRHHASAGFQRIRGPPSAQLRLSSATSRPATELYQHERFDLLSIVEYNGARINLGPNLYFQTRLENVLSNRRAYGAALPHEPRSIACRRPTQPFVLCRWWRLKASARPEKKARRHERGLREVVHCSGISLFWYYVPSDCLSWQGETLL